MKSKICGLFLSLSTIFTLCSCGTISNSYVTDSFAATIVSPTTIYEQDDYLKTSFEVELEYDCKVNIYYEIRGTISDSDSEIYNFYYKNDYMRMELPKDRVTNVFAINNEIKLRSLVDNYDRQKTYTLDDVQLANIEIVDVENGDSSKMYVYLLSGVGLIAAAGLVVGCFINNKKEENIIE